MEITVNIEDYLTQEELKEIAEQEYRYALQQNLRKEQDIDRIFTNSCYKMIWKILDEEYKNNKICFEDMLIKKIKHCIEDVSKYDIFRNEDYWDKDSIGQTILNEIVRNSRPQIEKRVNEIIEQYPFHELDDNEIGDVIYNCIMDKLFNNKED